MVLLTCRKQTWDWDLIPAILNTMGRKDQDDLNVTLDGKYLEKIYLGDLSKHANLSWPKQPTPLIRKFDNK